ncbi:MAG: response regulator transcription factor [Caenispirillum bisanense]|nr:response regulator transcription factor [Caenispirillum bisanense]MCA1972410.1 response regulator transcription factor [Caenispirillum sp.]
MIDKPVRILIADDHPLVRRALGGSLSQLGQVALEEAGSLEETLSKVAAIPDLDLVVFDLRMPGSSGLGGLTQLRTAAPAVPVVVLTADENPRIALKALEQGASGFIPKTAPEPVLLAAIRLVLQGGIYIPSMVAEHAAQAESGGGSGNSRSPRQTLTARQRDVLALVLEGLSNREIATRFNLSEATVKAHVTAILRAYNVASRAKLIRAASAEEGNDTRMGEV